MEKQAAKAKTQKGCRREANKPGKAEAIMAINGHLTAEADKTGKAVSGRSNKRILADAVGLPNSRNFLVVCTSRLAQESGLCI